MVKTFFLKKLRTKNMRETLKKKKKFGTNFSRLSSCIHSGICGWMKLMLPVGENAGYNFLLVVPSCYLALAFGGVEGFQTSFSISQN